MAASASSPDDVAAAERVVVAYANALDARDWARFEALFEPEVEIDYRSLGTTHGVFPAREWADRCRVLGAFNATHHKVSNFTIAFDGEDRCAVGAYVDAAHFIEADGQRLEAYVLGLYRHDLVRRAGGWRIRKCTLTVAGYPGGRARFDLAFAAARAVFAAQAEVR
jgi:hypothetical protein